MSALRGAARSEQSSSDHDSSFSAQPTAAGSCVRSQTSASAVSSFSALSARKPDQASPEGELLTVIQVAAEFGLAASAVHQWLSGGGSNCPAVRRLQPTAVEDHVGITVIRSVLMCMRVSLRRPTRQTESGRDEGCTNNGRRASKMSVLRILSAIGKGLTPGAPAAGDSGDTDRERLPPMVAELPAAHRPAPPRGAVHGFPLAWAAILEPGPVSCTGAPLAAHLGNAGRLGGSYTRRPRQYTDCRAEASWPGVCGAPGTG